MHKNTPTANRILAFTRQKLSVHSSCIWHQLPVTRPVEHHWTGVSESVSIDTRNVNRPVHMKTQHEHENDDCKCRARLFSTYKCANSIANIGSRNWLFSCVTMFPLLSTSPFFLPSSFLPSPVNNPHFYFPISFLYSPNPYLFTTPPLASSPSVFNEASRTTREYFWNYGHLHRVSNTKINILMHRVSRPFHFYFIFSTWSVTAVNSAAAAQKYASVCQKRTQRSHPSPPITNGLPITRTDSLTHAKKWSTKRAQMFTSFTPQIYVSGDVSNPTSKSFYLLELSID